MIGGRKRIDKFDEANEVAQVGNDFVEGFGVIDFFVADDDAHVDLEGGARALVRRNFCAVFEKHFFEERAASGAFGTVAFLGGFGDEADLVAGGAAEFAGQGMDVNLLGFVAFFESEAWSDVSDGIFGEVGLGGGGELIGGGRGAVNGKDRADEEWNEESHEGALANGLDDGKDWNFDRGVNAYVLIALGAALGGVARFGMTAAVTSLLGREFPYGTLLVNVTGALAIGFASAQPSKFTDAFWIVGVLGGYTTFSAFSLQALQLMQANRLLAAGAYVVSSVGICLLAVYAGQMIGRSRL